MNPTFESYTNLEFHIDLGNKPNLCKRLEAYSIFLSQLKTQMLRERIISIHEEESETIILNSSFTTVSFRLKKLFNAVLKDFRGSLEN